MAKINLSRMDVQALIDLRKQIEDTLVSQRSRLERQLAALGRARSPRLGWQGCPWWARERAEREKGSAEIPECRWRDLGGSWRNAPLVEGGD